MNEENYQLVIDKKTCKDNTEYEFAKLEIITRWAFVPLKEGSSLLVNFEKVKFPVIWSRVPETTLP